MTRPTNGRDTLSAGEAGRLCGVTRKTMAEWFDADEVQGYRLPHHPHARRVIRESLLAFMRRHGLPIPPDLERGPGRRVLLVGVPWTLVSKLADLAGDVVAADAGNGFDAGRWFAELHPAAVAIDLALGRSEALAMARSMRQAASGRALRLVALAYEDEVGLLELSAAFSEVLFQPVAPAMLAERLAVEG